MHIDLFQRGTDYCNKANQKILVNTNEIHKRDSGKEKNQPYISKITEGFQ